MSFIIGVTIGIVGVQLIQLAEDYENNFYSKNISKIEKNNINNFFITKSMQNAVNIAKVDNKNLIFRSEIIYKNEVIDETQNDEWKIRIPKIELEASIEEGTSQEILNEFVGHFEETNKLYGNVGLAAHNRGYNVNYFEKIKYLEIGDEIYYSYYGTEKVYIVTLKNIIEDTNWKVLENTKDNRITLITCVENKPKNRLCLQGIEK